MKKYSILGVVFCFVIGINLYFRSFPINFPQLKVQARQYVDQQIQNGAVQEIMQKFPQFNPIAKDQLVKSRIAEYKRANKASMNAQTQAIYMKMKDRFQDAGGQTFLFELDCWHWGRYVENILKYGRPGDEVIAGAQWDAYMLAPLGSYLHWDNFLFYFSAYVYKVFCIFNPVPLFTFLFYMPLLLSCVLLSCVFFFSYRYGRLMGAVTATMLLGLSPIFLARSCAGWFKRDPLTQLFPLLTIWFYLLSLEPGSFRKKTILKCIAAFWVGVFCFTWTFWWYAPALVVLYEAVSLGVLFLRTVVSKTDIIEDVKKRCFSLGLYLGFSLVWVLIFCGAEPLKDLYKQVTLSLILNKPLMASIWPNVYSTVGELRKFNWNESSTAFGSPLIAIASVCAAGWVFVRAFVGAKLKGTGRESAVMLAVWTLVMLFAATRGVRFVIFLLVPLGICLGWVLNDLYRYFLNRTMRGGIVLVVACFIAINSVFIAKGNYGAKMLYPLMNKTWYEVLTVIKNRTEKDTIINSWWDYGDWFKVVAKRRVIFDGQSQDTPQAHWMATALLSDNEEKATRILRMLNNGGNKAFEIINTYIKDPLEAVLLLDNVLTLKPDEAERKLLEKLPVPAAQTVLKMLFMNAGRSAFIVDSTMVPKMGAISYLGNWDFAKVYIAQNFKDKEKSQIMDYLVSLGKDREEMDRIYQEAYLISDKAALENWLSRNLMFYTALSNGVEKEGTVYFDNGFMYNLKEQKVRSNTGQIPRSFFVLQGDDMVEIRCENANIPASALIAKVKDTYKCILLDRELGKSLFVRLYFFNGQGLKHFIPFIDADEGNSYIRVFFISW